MFSNKSTGQQKKFNPGGVTDSIRKIIIASTIFITIGVTSMVSIQYLGLFRRISLQQQENQVSKQKEFVKGLIATEIDYISREKHESDSRIAGELSKNVCYAYSIAEGVYQNYHGKMPDEMLMRMIVEMVAAMKCTRPYTQVFINNLDGRGVYYPRNPARSGVNLINVQDTNGNFVVRRELELLGKNDEGFIWYKTDQEAEKRNSPGRKVAFVKKFKPYNWYFGAKCYLDDYEEDFKMKIARKISSERFDNNGYIFLTELGGDPVVYEGKVYDGKFNYYDGSDTSKMNVFKRMIRIAQSSEEGGFLTYEWNKADEIQKSKKTSYIRYFKECDWLIGAGFYEDEINKELIIQRKELKIGIISKLVRFFLILLIVLGVEILFIYKFSKSYKADFYHFADFFQKGKGKYEKINIDSLHFSEFRKMGIVANEMIGERARIHEELVAEQKKVCESDKLKTAFLANMSHEIRTPMNAIIGFSQLIDDESIPKEDRKLYLQLIRQNGEILMNLINDIIDIAKIESDQLKVVRREFKLDDLLANIHIYYQEYIAGNPDRKITFQMESHLPDLFLCNSDQFRLKQVLDNLIGNAIKFTPLGTIKLIVSEGDGKVYFKVRDTGIGISQEDQQFIFNRFMQARDHLRNNYGGTGLGLAISKNIVEQLGGEIGVRSVPGEGSEFYFYISC